MQWNWKLFAILLAAACACARAEWIWIEGEKPTRATVERHPWYTAVKKEQLSGGEMISNYSNAAAGEALYTFNVSADGEFDLFVRANPIQAKLSYRLNDWNWTPIDLGTRQSDSVNIAADNKPDMRFMAWINVGKVRLKRGVNTIAFRMDSAISNHGAIDCLVFTNEPFVPQGALKPDQLAAAARKLAEENQGWFAWNPKDDPFDASSGFDLRDLNEKQAGDGGYIAARDGRFIHGSTGRPVRFWAVNGPPGELKGEELRRCARMLAKRGVNLVRVHGGIFNPDGSVNMEKVRHTIEIVEAMKAEGIYTHLSIYFPLWITPKPGLPFLQGYDGKSHPFAALYFNPDFQKVYRTWWTALLTAPSERTGRKLADEPAVMGLEIINEDSYFFWTFAEKNIPDPQLRLIEKQFGDWLKSRHGSIEAALAGWGGGRLPRDNPAEGRVAFRPLWNMANERNARDRETARFLVEHQRAFYEQTCRFLRDSGFKGVITCSNWATASPQFFGPLEKYSYTAGDFIDRHGYFGCNHKGDNAAWSIRDGHTYGDRSALRFEPEEPGKPKLFVHPVMDIHYDDKPSMISETTFTRPNRYRAEATLYYAAYGALQESDAIVHFALDGDRWNVKPRFFMQPWTLMSPTAMGQFPAAALIYRRGLIRAGDTLVDLNLRIEQLKDLAGTPLPQDAAFDELRLKDVPQGTELKPGNVIDPLVHYAGHTRVRFTNEGGPAKLADLSRYIDRENQRVTSSTGELVLDYGKGVLTLNAPAAQGVVGNVGAAGTIRLKDISITCDMDLVSIVAVSLDGQPLSGSRKILLQAVGEEKASGFRTEPAGQGLRRIVSIGQDPWLARQVNAAISLNRADASQLRVTPLDLNGYPLDRSAAAGGEIRIAEPTAYYLIHR